MSVAIGYMFLMMAAFVIFVIKRQIDQMDGEDLGRLAQIDETIAGLSMVAASLFLAGLICIYPDLLPGGSEIANFEVVSGKNCK